jgi:tetratricopeptide (TPR) repeat protein
VSLALVGFLLCLSGARAEPRQDSAPGTSHQDQDAEVSWIEWGRSLLRALHEEDVSAFDRLVDANAIVDAAFKDVETTSRFATGFRAGILPKMTKGEGLYATLTGYLERGARFEFLRLKEGAPSRRALFRLIPSEGGVDYFEFWLNRREDGSVRAVDVYTASAGEPFSALVRRWLLPQAAENNKGMLGKLFGTEHALVQHWGTIVKVTRAAEAGDLEKFAKHLGELPEELGVDKTVILMRLRMFPGDDPRYLEALADLRRHYPEDPCTLVFSIDYFWLRDEHSKALEELEHLREWVGGDPYLHLHRGQLLLQDKSYDLAGVAARKAIDEGLGWVDPYWTLLNANLHQERFEEALGLLRQMDQQFELEWNDMTALPLYSGFVKSPQHAEWLEYLRTKEQSR